MKFIDLASQQQRLKRDVDKAMAAVLAHGRYILGPEVQQFEKELAIFSQAPHALGVANGTDAIQLLLMAWGIGSGDAVFCPAFTYCATAEAIAIVGATPVFVDVNRETYNLDAASLRAAIEGVVEAGNLVPKAVIAVDLFGQSADYPAIKVVTEKFGLRLMSDSAQGFGTTREGLHPIHWADATTTSFFPAKPLGAYGDGGAILTKSTNEYALLESLRFHGKGTERDTYESIGLNSRLDSLQAAILSVKLSVFAEEIEQRNRIADRYSKALRDFVIRVPFVDEGVMSTWAQYTIEVEQPNDLASALADALIPSARYYPRPVHRYVAYQSYPIGAGGLPNTEAASRLVISLPMHAYLNEEDQNRIIQAVVQAL